MAIPAIPAHGANWDGWAAGVDTAARNAAQIPDVATAGTPTGDALRAALVSPIPTVGSYTYNADGTIATDPDGNSYTWNADGTPATQTKGGITRTFHWNTDGSLASVS